MALNILIVDDSATVRAVTIKTLELAGVSVNELHQAGDGRKALDVLADSWIDLVFADINMPVMNGIELVDRMSADGLLKTVPVVIISTEGSATRVEQLMTKGISAYIRKPFTPELLRSVVDDIVGVQNAD